MHNMHDCTTRNAAGSSSVAHIFLDVQNYLMQINGSMHYQRPSQAWHKHLYEPTT
jgi:hypothetical protein